MRVVAHVQPPSQINGVHCGYARAPIPSIGRHLGDIRKRVARRRNLRSSVRNGRCETPSPPREVA
jgi:hypothetical protein